MSLQFDNFAGAGPVRRGSILITTMAVCFTLAAVVLVLCRKMAVEAVASANLAAQMQADTIERGAEQYCIAMLKTAYTTGQANGLGTFTIFDVNTYPEDYFQWVPCGDGFFSVVRPNYDDDSLPTFGLVDESSKLDLNYLGNQSLANGTARDNAYNMWLYLPGMTDDVAAAMIDWGDDDQDPYLSTGAESSYYLTLGDAYNCKDAAYEAVEEVLLVRGMTHEMIYGDGTAAPLGTVAGNSSGNSSPNSADNPQIARGLYDLLTVDSYAPPAANGGSFSRGLININTAPPSVLYCLEGLSNGAITDSDIQSLISERQQQAIIGTVNTTTWASAAGINVGGISQYITGDSYRYSADILAVSGNGRAFRRVKVVIDTQNIASGTVSIVSRRDLTDQGWPMDPQVLKDIRAGTRPTNAIYGSTTGGTQR